MTFEIGDIVRLKSGGPEMTVSAIGFGYVYCVWFDGKKRGEGGFDPATLEKSALKTASFSSVGIRRG